MLFNEEPLSDPLVHNDHCDVGLGLRGVVGLIDGSAKLCHFLLENLASHGITHTISVDDKVLRVVLVLVSKAAKSSLNCLLELRGNYLLALSLNDFLRVVLASLLVDCGAEANYALRAGVTNVNADQHGTW